MLSGGEETHSAKKDREIADKILANFQRTLALIEQNLMLKVKSSFVDCCCTEASIAMLFIADLSLHINGKDHIRQDVRNELLRYIKKDIVSDYLEDYFWPVLTLTEFVNDRIATYNNLTNESFDPIGAWFLGDRQSNFNFRLCMLLGDYIFFPYTTGKGIIGDFSDVPLPLLGLECLEFARLYFDDVFSHCSVFFDFVADIETDERVGERRNSEITDAKKSSANSKTAITVIAVSCLILVICLIWISSVLSRSPSPVQDPMTLSNEPEPASEPTPTPKPTPSPKPTPTPSPALNPVIIRNGKILLEPSSERLAPLTVKASEDVNYYILLNPINPPSNSSLSSIEERLARMRFMEGARMAFYVSAGKSAEVLVPLGDFEIYYATGQTWYGPKEKFGSDTQFYKCDDTFDFYEDDDGYVGWTLTLYKVSNGNMDTTSIDESDFPVF